jgi:SAM-dependent methyltransferase
MTACDQATAVFYAQPSQGVFERLYRQVNRQALGPFFSPWVHARGSALDAGSGDGHLGRLMGLSHACCIDLTINGGRRVSGAFVQGDIRNLPFDCDVFDEVVCSNVLHYTGYLGLMELFRVTKPGGRLFIAFLERSRYTRMAVQMSVGWGVFPQFMQDIPLLDVTETRQIDVRVEDSATVLFAPPFFTAARAVPRMGLVAYVLQKKAESQNVQCAWQTPCHR